jgi:hypothetical protein
LQDTLLSLEDRPGAILRVVPLEVAGLLAYASREGKDPASRQTRLDYSGHVSQDHDIAWPPERNAPCWCGSARKYKKCCGAPGFLAMPVPDPASLVLKIELERIGEGYDPAELDLDWINTRLSNPAQHLVILD